MNEEAESSGPSYWLDLFTATTWAEFVAAGATVSGFRNHARGTVARIRPGHLLLCYVTGVSRYVGLLEVVSEPYNDTATIWAEDTFPVRLQVRPVVQLDIEEGVPVVDLLPRFSWYSSDARAHSWSGHFRRSPKAMTARDGKMVADALQAAQADPVRRGAASAKLRRAAFKGGRPPRKLEYESPRVAEQPEPLLPTPAIPPGGEPGVEAVTTVVDDQRLTAGEVKEHTEVEGLLLELGSAIGLDLWIDRNDSGKVYNGRPLGDIPGVMTDLPSQFSHDVADRVRRIDVLWLRDGDVMAAFEVEATTAVYSGLLRLADLAAVQSHLRIALFIVAPEARREKVREEILRPAFRRSMRPPLAQTCRYISFDTLREAVRNVTTQRLGRVLRASVDEYLDTLAESFDGGA